MNTRYVTYHHEVLDSTQFEAERLLPQFPHARAGVIFAVTAHAQTHGRGRFNRTWTAAPGTCSLTTLVIRIPAAHQHRLPWLTAVCALGALDACRTLVPDLYPDITIKWPNDMMIDGHKCGGILATALPEIADNQPWVDVACGIGLNTTMSLTQLPVTTATSLAVAAASRGNTLHVDTAQMRAHVINAVGTRVEHWRHCEWDPHRAGIIADYRDVVTTVGQPVSATIVTDNSRRIVRGTFTDLTADGHAVITTNDGYEVLAAADVTLRPPTSTPLPVTSS